MLPFLKRTQDAAASGPVQKIERKPDEGAEESAYDGLEAVAEDLCRGITEKDYKTIAVAIRAAFEMLENEPHNEGEA